RPDRQLDLVLERVQVAVHVPHRHPEALGDVLRGHALGMRSEEARHAHEPRGPIALRTDPIAALEHHAGRIRRYRRSRYGRVIPHPPAPDRPSPHRTGPRPARTGPPVATASWRPAPWPHPWPTTSRTVHRPARSPSFRRAAPIPPLRVAAVTPQ